MNKEKIKFSKSKKKEVEGIFEGGDVTQDGGLLIGREIDRNYRKSTSLRCVDKI